MGNWSLVRLTGQFSTLTNATNFGHNFNVHYWMKYTPTKLDHWKEPPKLDWHERVIRKEFHNTVWFEYEMNMYTLKPQSNTLIVWSRRYIEAYNKAYNLPQGWLQMKGSSQLLDLHGAPVSPAKLGFASENFSKAHIVRNYLKNHGGMLHIEVHDIPSIALPLGQNEHLERVLLFNVGVEGGGLKVRAEQHLIVNAHAAQGTWTQNFTLAQQTQWATNGLNKIPTPATYIAPSAPSFSDGECW